MMTRITVVLAVLSVTMATVGQLFLRAGMVRVGYIGEERIGSPFQLAGNVLREPRVALGLAAFGISAAIWLVVLSRVPISVAYPFAGLTYVLVAMFGKYVLGEPVPALRWAGLLLIITGIAIVARTAPPGVD